MSRIFIVSLICRHDQLIAHVIVADGLIIPYDLKSHPKLHSTSFLVHPALALNRNIPIRYDIPGFGRSAGGGHGNPLQYSCLENPHGQRSLAGYSSRGHKSLTQLSDKAHIRYCCRKGDPFQGPKLGSCLTL